MIRAVIYCRCSTEEESQKDALIKQTAEAQECVKKQGWVLTDTYVESRSGTSTRGRTEYNRLYEDLRQDRFDLIVIKSQDRLMRNTKDWYLFIDRLTSCGKRLYLYLEKKFYSTDDALITGIKAILAEDYSRELSKKMNHAHYSRQKNNGAVILTSNTYGYARLPDRRIAVIEEEAEVKRRMYQLCAAGYGSRVIASILKKDGIVNRKGKPFSDSDIRRMIRSPLNKGTAVMNRLHFDFEAKQMRKVPYEEQFVYENKVPAIVSAELWEKANREIDRRAGMQRKGELHAGGRYTGKSCLSGKLFCGLCQAPYYRTVRSRSSDGRKHFIWKCRCYLENGRDGAAGGCENVSLEEDTLLLFLYDAFEKICRIDEEHLIEKMTELLNRVLQECDSEAETDRERKKQEQIKKQMGLLVDKLLDGIIADDLYQMKQKELEEAMQKSQRAVTERAECSGKQIAWQERLRQLTQYLRSGDGIRKAFAVYMLEQAEKVVVYPRYLELWNFVPVMEACGQGESQWMQEQMHLWRGTLRIELGTAFDYPARKQKEREAVVAMMQKNPKITAGQIARELQVSLSGANYRIRALKREGRIRFHKVAGERGVWEILTKSNDPKDSGNAAGESTCERSVMTAVSECGPTSSSSTGC